MKANRKTISSIRVGGGAGEDLDKNLESKCGYEEMKSQRVQSDMCSDIVDELNSRLNLIEKKEEKKMISKIFVLKMGIFM